MLAACERLSWRWCGCLLLSAVLGLALQSGPACAASRGAIPRATSSNTARKEAMAAMPLAQLTPEQQQNITAVLNKTTIYRRLPPAISCCDPELYLFILNHPEILANIWQLMDIEDVVLRPVGPNRYVADDGDGTKGEVEFLHRGPNMHLLYAEGRYDGPLFTQPITGKCVLLLRSGYVREPDGHYYVTTQMDAFVQLDNLALDALAKTFQPLVCRVADYNFLVTAQFVEALSKTAEVNQMGMQRLAANLENLNPQVRDDFATLAYEVSRRAVVRASYQSGQTPRTVEQRRGPIPRTIE